MHINKALELLTTLQWMHELELELGYIDFKLDSKKVVDSFVANRCGLDEI